MSLALSVSVFPGNELIGETHATLGIDLQAPLSTPGRKAIRLDINFLDGVPVSFEPVKEVLSLLEPLPVS